MREKGVEDYASVSCYEHAWKKHGRIGLARRVLYRTVHEVHELRFPAHLNNLSCELGLLSIMLVWQTCENNQLQIIEREV